MPTVGARWVTASIRASPRAPPLAGATPTTRPLFWNVNDDLGLTQFLGQTLVFTTEFLYFVFLRTAFRLGAALVWGQAPDNAGLPLTTPGDQRRGIKALASQKGANRAGLGSSDISFGQDALFVFGREGAALGVGDDLRIRSWRGRRLGRDGFTCRCTPGGPAPLRRPPL